MKFALLSGIAVSITIAHLPTIVMVPGAWHTSKHFKIFSRSLEKLNFPSVSIQMPDLGSAHPNSITVTDDVNSIRSILLYLLSEGKEVILLSHSWGGGPAGTAVNGLSKVERQSRGEKGGVVGLIFIAAFLARKGVIFKDALGGKLGSFVLRDTPGVGNTLPNSSLAIDAFYHDVPLALATRAVLELLPVSENAFATPSPSDPGWLNEGFKGRLAWIYTEQDHSVPPATQDSIMNGSGQVWDVRKMNTSHSPFLSQPDLLAVTIEDLANGWASS
ncbi:Alpha/beta hydrolase fold-1 [Tricladium varicosporioides]|nr:Alpha/beta hydrolase fold-1 [Hymenoscyphus varicosporioides]